jgi:hypothetical protein
VFEDHRCALVAGLRMPSRSRIDAMISPAWHTTTTVSPACSPPIRSAALIPTTRRPGLAHATSLMGLQEQLELAR